ncbi:sensor histidine kinase [Telluribacter humicola]|uniref:sensor histidine kinase n=1 Tax=Telluribacter humicola TaxID=1720261 RepID=UPI001A96CA40|nr:ATP-binding protein [Telluribacter humicola]
MNIKARLTLLFTLLVASIMIITRIGIYIQYDQYREEQFYSYLKDRATTIVQLIEGIEGISDSDIKRIEEKVSTVLMGEEITVYDSNDSVIYDSGKVPFPVTEQVLAQVRGGSEIHLREDSKEVVMIRHIHEPGQKPWVVVAYASDIIGLNKLNRLRDILAYGWLISLVVVGGAGWLFAKDALKPVSEIIKQVNNISAGNLYDRLRVGREKDELNQLAATFNLMLNRIELAFTSQKSFVSHASHELRTPLSVIMGEVEVTLMKKRTGEAYEETLKRVLEEVRNLNSVVNGLLEMARTESNVSTSFRKIRVDEVLWQAQTQVMQKNAEYKVEIQYDEIPENEEDLQLEGDETLLRTAFTNLMENACKYSENRKVEVLLEVKEKTIRVHFKDQGVGISEEHLPQLFDTFYRVSSVQNTHGFGIGLALVKRIVDMHQGQIHVNSSLGVGSTFIVSLPQF